MGKWQIGGIEFSSKEEYKAGCRDLKRIQTLAAGVDLDDHREAAELYQMLRKQPFLFESELGAAFRGFLNDKADGMKHPRGSFPEECLYAGKTAARRKKAALPKKSRTGGKNAKDAMRAQRMKLRERDIGSGEDEEPLKAVPDEGADRAVRGRGKGRILKPLCIVAGALLMLFALYRIFSYDIWSYISERKMEELAACILTPIEPEVSEAHRIADLIASGMYTEEEAVEIAKREQQEKPKESVGEDGILYRYSVLYKRNGEMAGWIQLSGTVINYPVMLTPQDEEYYLKKGFDKKYDINGIPFMDARCSVKEPTTNFLIYGHNMKNGSMFSALLGYEQEAFYEEHPVIRFDTVYERGEYEIVGVFRTQIPYESDGEAYRYYSFIDTKDPEEYNAYIRYVKEQSFYETGVTAEFGTQLLTLSTCDRSVEAGRFVVVARKK
ncbi:MAG: class B sortase [Lachnospiraceae bacterium]|nr:class B sortase [Lachnospiraceae bacterium]